MTDTTTDVTGRLMCSTPVVVVTADAVAAAIQEARWGWEPGDGIPLGPSEVMRDILAAAAPLMTVPAIAAVLALHGPECYGCGGAAGACTCAEAWRGEEARAPEWRCKVCVASWGDEATEPWPCSTAQALGVGNFSLGVGNFA